MTGSREPAAPLESVLLPAAAGVLGVLLLLDVVGAVAGAIGGGGWVFLGPGEMVDVALSLPGSIDDPRSAWPTPVQERLPGPAGFALALALLVGLIAAVLVPLARRRSERGSRAASARWASRRDLRALSVLRGLRTPRDPRPRPRSARGQRAGPVGPRRRSHADRQDDRPRDPGDPGVGRPGPGDLGQVRPAPRHARPPGTGRRGEDLRSHQRNGLRSRVVDPARRLPGLGRGAAHGRQAHEVRPAGRPRSGLLGGGGCSLPRPAAPGGSDPRLHDRRRGAVDRHRGAGGVARRARTSAAQVRARRALRGLGRRRPASLIPLPHGEPCPRGVQGPERRGMLRQRRHHPRLAARRHRQHGLPLRARRRAGAAAAALLHARPRDGRRGLLACGEGESGEPIRHCSSCSTRRPTSPRFRTSTRSPRPALDRGFSSSPSSRISPRRTSAGAPEPTRSSTTTGRSCSGRASRARRRSTTSHGCSATPSGHSSRRRSPNAAGDRPRARRHSGPWRLRTRSGSEQAARCCCSTAARRRRSCGCGRGTATGDCAGSPATPEDRGERTSGTAAAGRRAGTVRTVRASASRRDEAGRQHVAGHRRRRMRVRMDGADHSPAAPRDGLPLPEDDRAQRSAPAGRARPRD